MAQHGRLDLFQDSDFAGDLEDSKSTSGVLSVGSARNKLQSRTNLQSLRLFLWMLDHVWMGYLLLIFGT